MSSKLWSTLRATLALDDVFAFVRACAQCERISIGLAVSRLVRDGILVPATTAVAAFATKSECAWLSMRLVVMGSRSLAGQMTARGPITSPSFSITEKCRAFSHPEIFGFCDSSSF